MEVVKVKAEKRENLGSAESRRIRKAGNVPGVICGDGEVLHFVSEPLQFRELIYTPMLKICEIDVDGNIYRCIIKEAQFHPVTDDLVHVDLQHLIDGNTVSTSVPLRTVGEPLGLQQGGKLIQKIRKIKIRTIPEHLVDELTVNVEHLDFKESVRIVDINLPEGIEIRQNYQLPIATVDVPRVLRMPKLTVETEEGVEGEELEEGEEAGETPEGEEAVETEGEATE